MKTSTLSILTQSERPRGHLRLVEEPSSRNAELREDGPLHVAIIMDGNGRWAQRQGLKRSEGHVAGAKAVRRTVEAAPALGITTLTLYAFSSDNWRRPPEEVGHLMRLLRSHLSSETQRCVEEGVRISVIGRRDRLPAELRREIERAELKTLSGGTLHLRLAVDYSSRDALLRAATLLEGDPFPSRETFSQAIAQATHAAGVSPDVDLLIRTGGEARLSDFLLWESAYAELVFLPCLWPDLSAHELSSAVAEFSQRDRRFGGLTGRDASQRVSSAEPGVES